MTAEEGDALTRPAPARDRIVADVERRINGGELQPGDPVASESELAARFAVSRGTVRSALTLLAAGGAIDPVPGLGWFVRDSTRPAPLGRERAAAVVAELRAEVLSGSRDAGAPFLSEKAVCERFDLTRHAARAALAALEVEGLIVAIHGRGRFVAPVG